MKTKFSITKLTFLSIVIFGMFLTDIAGAQGWFDQNWQYRRPVNIANPGGTALTNYQVMIILNNTSFDFSKAKSDGSDVRATDTDGMTLLPFWIEEWNSGTQLARVWVKIPSIPSGGSTVYLYYGYSTATTASDGTNTFTLFDDNWISSSGNLNPVQVATQPWWEATVSYPIVFEDNSFPDRPRFHMLYDGHDAIGHAKGYSTSPNLVNWTAYDNELSGNARINPIMGVGYTGSTQFAWGDMIKVGSTYHMYPSSGPGTTVHCQSTDLIHWTNQSGGSVTFDALSTNDGSGIGTGVAILKEADGKTPVVVDNKYWMIYFHGFSGGNMYMAYADIGNLLSWTTCYSGSPVLTPSGWEGGGLWTPSFVKVNDKYYIYYQAGSPYKIGFASALSTSGGNPVRPDQTPWTKSPNNPVITNTHGWDVGFCQDPVLRCFDGVYYIFYTGDPPWRNGFAYSSSPEGPWIQYGQSGGGGVNWSPTGTPIVSNGIVSFASGSAFQSPALYTPGTAVGFRANFGPQGGSENRWGGFITGTGGATPPDRAIIQKQVTPTVPDNNHAYLSTHPTYIELSLLDNQFHVYELLWRSGRADAIRDHGAASVFTTSNIPSASLPVTFYNYAGTSSLQVDWVFVRQYTSPEPTNTVGAEQPLCPSPPGVSSPVTYCEGATAVPLTATGSNLLWYTAASGGAGSPTAPTPSTTTVGTKSYWVSQTVNGCESDRMQIDVIVNETPAAPTADVTQPSCTVPTGTITVTSSISGLSFSINGVNYTNTTGVFTGLNPGNYNLTAKNSYECISAATPIVINTVPGAPTAPTVNVTQPTCTLATGTITITAPTGTGMTYSIDGTNYTNTTGVFTDVSPGNYSVTAKDISGCFSPVTNVTVNPAPPTPQAPTANASHPTCFIATGTITVTSSLSGLSFSIDGADYSNTTGIFTGVVPGEYPLTAKNSSNCISTATIVTVNPVPPPPTGTIAAVDPDLCYGDLYYQLKLSTATGQAPYSIVVDGKTYTNVNVGQTFATFNVFESIWNNSTPGTGIIGGGGADWELGVKFRAGVNGYVKGIRFYKAGSSNGGTHVGSLWTWPSSGSGTNLISATFTNETTSGWQEVLFSTPVAITAGTVYVASYSCPQGNFYYTTGGFGSGVTNGNLYALSNTDLPAPVGNGVYNLTPGNWPSSPTGSNYWVDVVFSTWNNLPATLTSNLTSITTANGCNNTNTLNPLSSASVTINVSPAGTISSAGAVCEGTDMSLIFNASVGNGPFSLVVNGNAYDNITSGIPFNVGNTGSSQAQSIWPSTNGTDNGPNTTSLELGVKFRSSVAGQITGIRFYKVSSLTTGYSGRLWLPTSPTTGTILAEATFTNLPASGGWQQVNFSTPVAIQPDVTYIASYHIPGVSNSNFAANIGYFATSGVTSGALTALANNVDGPNGVYAESVNVTYPTTTHQSTNYWVDVVFVSGMNNNFNLTSITSTNGCTKTGNPISTAVVPVNPLPIVTWPNTLASQCASSTSYVLTGGSPSGGTYSGDGVSDGIFNASSAGLGPHTLTYSYANPTTLCSNSATNGIYVNANPAATASSNSAVLVGTPLNLFSGPEGMLSYLWNGPASFSSNEANPTRDPAVLSYGGTYSVTVTNGNGCSATASTVVIVNESNAIVSGNIKYFNGATTPLQNINIKLKQGVLEYTTTPTNSNGQFSFANVAPGTYDVMASSGNTVGGINVTDAAQTNYWSVFYGAIEKVRFLAGDVTGDNEVRSADASNILQYFLTQGNPTPAFASQWSFWKTEDMIDNNPGPEDYPTINVSGSNVTQNLYGLVTGDFNQSFVPGGMKAVSESLTLIYGETISVIPEMEFDLPLSVAMDMEVGAVSLILDFPSDLMEVNGVYLTDDPNTPVMYEVSGDEIRIGWNSIEPVSLMEGENLLTLKVKVIGSTGEEGIRFKLAADPLNELADGGYNVISNAVLSIDIVKTVTTGTGEIALSDRLTLANHPNPFTGKTTFTYSLPVDGKVTLEIYDIVGNKVKSLVDETQPARDYVLSLDEATLKPGVYTATIKLDSNGNLMTRTIKIISKQ